MGRGRRGGRAEPGGAARLASSRRSRGAHYAPRRVVFECQVGSLQWGRQTRFGVGLGFVGLFFYVSIFFNINTFIGGRGMIAANKTSLFSLTSD